MLAYHVDTWRATLHVNSTCSSTTPTIECSKILVVILTVKPSQSTIHELAPIAKILPSAKLHGIRSPMQRCTLWRNV